MYFIGQVFAYIAIPVFIVCGMWGEYFRDVPVGIIAGVAIAYMCVWAAISDWE